ncbi:MAG: hypothetical protein QM765_49380 [Myxococcales bacterium]
MTGSTALVHGTSATNLWVFDYDGVPWAYDGTSWKKKPELAMVSPLTVSGLWVAGKNDVFAYESAFGLLHWNGTSWRELGDPNNAGRLWGASARDLFLAGARGIQRYR